MTIKKLTWKKCECGYENCQYEYPNEIGSYNHGTGFFPEEKVIMNKAFERLNEMSASEALFSFVAWLTCRDEKTIFSSSNNAGIGVELIDKFCKVNNLTEPSNNWTDKLTHPKD